MGDRLHPFIVGLRRETAAERRRRGVGRGGGGKGDRGPSPDVGEHYCLIGPELLIEKGDEYLDADGRFTPFPLEAIGRWAPTGLVVRRPLER